MVLFSHRVDGSGRGHVMTGGQGVVGGLDSTSRTAWPYLLTWRERERERKGHLIYLQHHYKIPQGGIKYIPIIS